MGAAACCCSFAFRALTCTHNASPASSNPALHSAAGHHFSHEEGRPCLSYRTLEVELGHLLMQGKINS